MTRQYPPRGASLEERLDFWTEVTDQCWMWQGSRNEGGYGQIFVDGRTCRVHRVVVELVTGEPIPEGMVVNHLCGVRACCRPDHLELVTPLENARYLTVLRPENKSGYRGVHFAQARGKWRARVKSNGKSVHFGYFDTAEEANEAAIAGRAELYGPREFVYEQWQAAA